MKTILAVFAAFCAIFSDSQIADNQFFTENSAHDFHFPYSMSEPDVVFDLPYELREISGLSTTDDPNILIGNNDEDGKIYFINKTTGIVEKAVEFWKEGDYEGIEMVNGVIYLVKSTGTIYEVADINAGHEGTVKHKFFLKKEYDVEALGLDAKNNRLLVGCKGQAGEGGDFKRKKAVYGFDLATKTMKEEPVFLFSIENVCDYLGHCTLEEQTLEKLHVQFDPHSEEFTFNPSSIAIHPKTGHIFMTSSKGKLIMVLSDDGKVLHIEKLNKKLIPQPEGLCFDADGTLWLSSEKKKEQPAKVYKYLMK